MQSVLKAAALTLAFVSVAPVEVIAGAGSGGHGGSPSGNHLGWCRGNGNPHGGNCASGSTGGSINTNTGHSTPPTATEAPHAPQSVTGTYGQSFTGYGPVPTATATPGTPLTGYGAVPPMPPQLAPSLPPQLSPPPLLPGYVQHPNFTGTRDPATGFPAPVPPQQVTGTYAPPVTGYGPVPPLPQQQAAVPKPTPNPRPVRTSSGGANITINPSEPSQPIASQMVARHAGRQLPNAHPQFIIESTGESWTCAASGLQRRRHVDERGAVTFSGVLPNLAMVDPLIRDIPAFHEHHAECLIGVQRRNGQQGRSVER